MLPRAFTTGTLVACIVAALPGARANAADDTAEFYRGKTITLLVGAPAGSDQDLYARLLARHLGRHVPGHPTIAAVNKAGGGGRLAAAVLFSSRRSDGTLIGAVPPGALAAPLPPRSSPTRPYEPLDFAYLGSASSENNECFVNADSPLAGLRDAFAHEVVMGAAANGGPTRDGPVLLNALLGTKFRVVAGFKSLGDILHAIKDGKVAGACGLTWSSVSARHPEWIAKGELRGLVQESMTGSVLASRFGVPRAADFVKSAIDREVLTLAYAGQAFREPYILPPGTSPARLAALRQAFTETLHAPEFLADARDRSLHIDLLAGDTVEALLRKFYGAPPQALARLREVLAAPRTR